MIWGELLLIWVIYVYRYLNFKLEIMKQIFQVLNQSGNPAGTEITNPQALFLSQEEVDEYLNYLKDELSIDTNGFLIVIREIN